MSKKVIRPCIRGLKRFEKCGCPEKYFDPATGEGCPAWKEYTIPGAPDEMPNIIKDCIDCLSEHWRFESLKLLEGNQVATESLRNGICEEGPDGFVCPKPNRDVLALAAAINAENKTLKAFIQSHNIVGIAG
ncbi:hypothetical protein [uncultured Desulfobacter sp.]|uniref:hypothetical protein n=1 Tax=uncultured Desulfobacter sp. TaxID=240139 RepID=UPI0029F5283E|nr:hypothetical protein [uncultured Desulfobacter sp.]